MLVKFLISRSKTNYMCRYKLFNNMQLVAETHLKQWYKWVKSVCFQLRITNTVLRQGQSNTYVYKIEKQSVLSGLNASCVILGKIPVSFSPLQKGSNSTSFIIIIWRLRQNAKYMKKGLACIKHKCYVTSALINHKKY